MFAEINERISEIITSESSLKTACEEIVKYVASETTTRSETMLSDMCYELYKKVVDSMPDASMRNRFRNVDLEQEISEKYNFAIPSNPIDFREANCVYTSLAAGAGTSVIGGLLVYALVSDAPKIPSALVVVASISAFCLSYFKVTPNVNKSNFKTAVNSYLLEAKISYLAWFDEVERYYNKRVDEIRRLL
jgi:hypothetical protein